MPGFAKRSLAERNDRGVVLPLLSVIILTLITVLFALAIDTRRVKEAQVIAYNKVVEICTSASKKLPIYRSAVEAGIVHLKGIDVFPGEGGNPNSPIDVNSYTRFSRVRFTGATSEPVLGSGVTYLAGYNNIPINDPPFNHTDNCQHSICSFSPDPTVEGTPEEPGPARSYPAGFLDPEYANGYIGCEVEMEVDTLVSGKRKAVAKTAYRVRIKGPLVDTDEKGLNNHGHGRGRGMTIGIAPQAELEYDERSHFSSQYRSIDPLWPPGNPELKVFTEPREKWVGNPFSFGAKFSDNDAITDPVKREHAIQRCYNPFLAARNLILQSIVARFARLWNTRDNTQLLVIGTKNGDDSYSPPTFLAERGNDMLARQFEQPYVNFKVGGRNPDLRGSNGSLDGGLCPMDTDTGGCAAEDVSRMHMLIASQMRDCFYVSNSDNGIPTLEDWTLDNHGYEPRKFAGKLRVAPSYPEPNEPYWGFTKSSHFMTAEELIKTMPNIEECPFDWEDSRGHHGINFEFSEPVKCTRPVPLYENDFNKKPNGLAGDIVSFLKYTAGNFNSYAQPLYSHSNSYAIRSPGYFACPNCPDASLYTVENPEINDPDPFTSHVLVVISKRLDPEHGEKGEIRDQVEILNGQGRMVFVLYIPTNLAEGQNAAVWDDIKEAFKVNSPLNYGERLAPGADYCVVGESEGSCLQRYWEDVLTPGGEYSYKNVADGIFEFFVEREIAL